MEPSSGRVWVLAQSASATRLGFGCRAFEVSSVYSGCICAVLRCLGRELLTVFQSFALLDISAHATHASITLCEAMCAEADR